MLRKFLLVGLWTPLCLTFFTFNLMRLKMPEREMAITKVEHVAAVPLSDNISRSYSIHTGKVLGASVVAGDARLKLLESFMSGTPLFPYAGKIIELADTYQIDYRLVPAIGMCESNLGKRIPSSDSYNAFGIAVYTGQQTGAKFENWNKALEWVFEFIDTRYISRNIIDLKQIGASWAPPSLEKDNSWANCVEKFMRSIE
jgi:hypothetical protein